MAKDLLDEDETRFSRAAHRRSMWLIGVAIACVFALFVMIATPLLVFNTQDHRAAQKQMREVSDVFFDWKLNITTPVANVKAYVNTIAGCVQARMHNLTHHAINDLRTDDLYNAELDRRFRMLADLISTEIPSIAQQMIAPAGIVTYLEPYDASVIGHNMFDPTDPVFRDEPSAYDTMRNGKIIVIGPYHVQTDVLKETWALVVRQPVFNTSDVALQSEDNFWGFTNIFLNVTDYLLVNKIDESMQESNMDYLLYGWTPNGTLYEVASSLPPPVSQRAMKEFILSTSDNGRLLDEVNFSLAVHSHSQARKVNANVVCIIVACSTFIIGLVYFLCALVILHCMTLYDGRRYAPKRPPFAVLTVGPCYGEELWNLVPAQMAEVTESLNRVLDRQMAAHHAYKIFQMHPYTTSYVILSVEGAVRMAFSILEELQRHPIDEPLTTLLGEDGRLLTSLAVHWCSNATVTVSLVGEDTYRYEGPDMVYGARMWIFASPNTVTISAAAQAMIHDLADVSIEDGRVMRAPGSSKEEQLYTITCPQRARLQRALYAGLHHPGRPTQRAGTTPKGSPVLQDMMPSDNGFLITLVDTFGEGYASDAQHSAHHHDVNSDNYDSSLDNDPPRCEDSQTVFRELPYLRRRRRSRRGSGSYARRRGEGGRSRRHSSRQSGSRSTSSASYSDAGHSFGASVNAHHAKASRPVPAAAAEAGTSPGAMAASAGGEAAAMGQAQPVTPEADREKAAAEEKELSNSLVATCAVDSTMGFPRLARHSDDTAAGANRAVTVPTTRVLAHAARERRRRNSSWCDNSLTACLTPEADALTQRLLHPCIPLKLSENLRSAFSFQAIALDVSYDAMHVVVYYFYVSYKQLFGALAKVECNNIFQRLVTAFGVPRKGILEHLAARCALRYLQQNEQSRMQPWLHQLAMNSILEPLEGSNPLCRVASVGEANEL